MEASDESPQAALFRELEEELNWPFEQEAQFIGSFEIESDNSFTINVFEILLPHLTLIEFATSCLPNEGYGQLLAKNRLFDQPWVWNLDGVIRKYLNK